jgi:hypothetical protein
MIVQGGYERLRLAEFPDEQPTKDCIVKTMKRIAVSSFHAVVCGLPVIDEHMHNRIVEIAVKAVNMEFEC